MKKRFIAPFFGVVLSTGLLFSSFPNVKVFADENIDQEIQLKQQEINSIGQQEREMKETLNQLDAQVKQTNEKIAATKKDISKSKKEAKQLEEDITELEKRMEARLELLKKRARSIQTSGGATSYLDVLLNAESFRDFVDRAFILNTIFSADKNILEEQEEDKAALEKSETDLKAKLDKVQSELKEVEELKVQLTYQINDKNSMLASMEEQRNEASRQLKDLKNQKAILIEQAKAEERRRAIEEAQEVKTVESDADKPIKNNGKTEKRKELAAPEKGKTEEKAAPTTPSKPVVSHNSSAIEMAIQVGSTMVGRSSYGWGAIDVKNRRFDCSGFVHWAYSSAGVNIGRSTSVLAGQGKKVSVSEMKRGDLIFFNTYKTNGHVGIYLGNGTFLNSNSSHGVSVDSLSNTYWKNAFKGHVRRVVN
ncbi:C40 family peptidase [Bacillus sp. FJAT-49711]|uniref:coiled-coil domain-containing protein n=1 Tax=Bacillus sp. FJAT-49711 TaxID=2833585 RepID=UPI001BC9CD11|nr:C40 family peptidase [Bacillus sp. FJAT-49711]